MIHQYSIKFANYLATENIIEPQRASVYAYGLELIISGFIGVSLMVIVSIVLDYPLLWLPYLLGYVIFRNNAGGFHAKSHTSCIITFLTLYGVSLLVHSFLLSTPYFPLIISLICIFPVIHYAPLNVKNNPLSAPNRKKRRRISLIVSIFNILIAVIGFIFQICSSIYIAYYLGVMAASLLFIFAIIQQKLERREKNEEQTDASFSQTQLSDRQCCIDRCSR